MAQITWQIAALEVQPQADNLVVVAHWRCISSQKPYSAEIYGTCSFAAGGTFTPYEQLTETQVLTWCWSSGVEKAAIEKLVLADLESQAAPQVIQAPLPWIPQLSTV